MTLIDILYCLMLLEMIACIVWRIICIFKKRGSCKFARCPFRKDFFSTSCLELVDDFLCDKCLPTDEEIEEQKRILKDLEKYCSKNGCGRFFCHTPKRQKH